MTRFDEDPREEVTISGADFALMTDEIETIKAERDQLRAELVSNPDMLKALVDGMHQIRSVFDELVSFLDLPDKNCSCHIMPPCDDCVEYSVIRECIQTITKKLDALQAAPEVKP